MSKITSFLSRWAYIVLAVAVMLWMLAGCRDANGASPTALYYQYY